MKYLIQLFLEIILMISLIFNVFVSNNTNNIFVVAVLIVFLILCIILYKFVRPRFRGKKEIMIAILCMCTILMFGLYLVGLKTGFNTNFSVIYKKYITTWNWLSIFIVVGLTEMIRYIMSQINARNEKKYLITTAVMLINFVLIDLSVMTKVYNYANFNQLYEFLAMMLIPSISKNALLMFTTKKYGFEPCLLYRLIMDLYVYFIPVTPKLNIFINGVILLVFPYFVYRMLLTFEINTRVGPAKKEKKKNDTFSTIVLTIVFGVLVMLVSREFTYSMIAIGSESMSGAIEKGDAVIYKSFDKGEEYNEGDILVFNRDSKIIVHRIVKKIKLEDQYAYQTKGDKNKEADNWIVLEEDIVGAVQFRILWIAWPSVILNEIF